MFDDIAEIIRVKRPKIVLLENVKNLIGPRHIQEWRRIVSVMRDLGYRISSEPAEFSPHLLPRSLGGRPQHRARIFITATHNPDSDGRNTEDPEPVINVAESATQTWDLLRDLPLDANVSPNYSLASEELLWLEAWDEVITRWRSKNETKFPGFPIWSDYWQTDLPPEYESFPAWKKKFVDQNMSFYQSDSPFLDNWLEKWDVRAKFPTTKRKFEWQAGQSASVWDCLIQFRPSGIRVKRKDYIPTLVALNQTPIFGPLRRRLTEREVARAQGFPENFSFAGQASAFSYKQMGNAVNIGVIAHVLRKHCERDQDVLQLSEEGKRILSAVRAAPLNPDDVFLSWQGNVRSQNFSAK